MTGPEQHYDRGDRLLEGLAKTEVLQSTPVEQLRFMVELAQAHFKAAEIAMAISRDRETLR